MALRWITGLLVGLTFCLLLLGGIVHSTGSSLACPDWPLCYGQVFPEMKGGVAIEHSHRLLAATVGLLTIGLVIISGRRRHQERGVWRLSLLALILVIFQGILGGITVIYKLPTMVSTSHLGLSMIFFSLLIWITLRVWLPDRIAVSGRALKEAPRRWIQLTTAVIYLQMVLGAFMRHTGASLACPDVPLCFGFLWPADLPPFTQLHMAHRWMGMLVLLCILASAIFVRRRYQEGGGLRFLANNAILLVFLQIGLGLASVWTSLNLWVVTAHLAGGALLLASFVTLWNLSGYRPLDVARNQAGT